MLAKARYVILLAIVFGLLASYSVYRYLLRYDAMVEAKEIVTSDVVVAAHDVEGGRKLGEEDVEVVAWPIELVPQNHFASAEEVVGRVSRHPVVHGEAIVEARLAPLGSDQGLGANIPEGYRAMTVPVNLVSGVSGFVLPGSRVDVLVSMRTSDRRREPVAKTILQDVRVIAVDQHLEGRDGRPLSSRAVTLLVEPTDAERLGLASTEGTLLLALRNSSDQGTESTAGTTVAALMSTKKPAPARRAPAPTPVVTTEQSRRKVEVIRGTQRSTEELDD
ncbi:MAG: Flp pilus assembly protein CpaB [Candidatus Eiseniibacteriota bacterium]|jgi:pilus assembly protein CpaB